jgi:hypothetical protein
MLQQSGSIAQTFEQHAGSSQPGSACTTRQLPVAPSQAGSLAQKLPAAATQDASQFTPQQKGSLLHTLLQQVTELQPGVS